MAAKRLFVFLFMAGKGKNNFTSGPGAGRPAYYETPEDLQKQVLNYFQECDSEGIKTTVTGLCLYLGFAARSSLEDYIDKGGEFSYIIKRAKLAVENGYETAGATIDIFALKNMGWVDKSEVDNTHKFINKPSIRIDFGNVGENYTGD